MENYFKTNPGALVIMAFEVLLLVAALLLLLGNRDSANQVGVYAFLTLILGIGVQMAYPVWVRRKHARADR